MPIFTLLLLNQLVWDTLYIHIILSSKRHFSTQVAETMGALVLTLPLTVWALKHSGNTSSGEKHLQASSEQKVVAKVPSGWRQAGLVICHFLYSNFWFNGQIENFKAVVSNQGFCSKCLYSLQICNTYYLNLGCSYLDIWFGNWLQVFNEDAHLPSPAMSHGHSYSGTDLAKLMTENASNIKTQNCSG